MIPAGRTRVAVPPTGRENAPGEDCAARNYYSP